MNQALEENVWYWKEYPERDVEYVRFYPPAIGRMEGAALWEVPYRGSGDLGIYIHVPYCSRICPFCPYNKYTGTPADLRAYVETLRQEIALYAERSELAGRPLAFIYFGGGTPSLLEPEDYVLILGELSRAFGFTQQTEVTLEIHPSNADTARLRGYRESGVTRASFGVQSYQAAALKRLGAHHSAAQSHGACAAARAAGFDNVAIDLLFRQPGQTLSSWEDDVLTASETGVDHISCYSLTVSPFWPYGRALAGGRIPAQPGWDADLAMSERAFALLEEAGYRHTSSCASCGFDFARQGKACRYEMRHWGAPQIDYLALGPGAFGYVQGHIYCTHHHLADYHASVRAGRIPVAGGLRLTEEEHRARFMVLGVKTLSVSKARFQERFGVRMEDIFAAPLARLCGWGLVEEDQHEVRVTRKGRFFLDNISKAFYTREHYRVPQPPGEELWEGPFPSVSE